ncbi:hypothetical protein [uncultured Gimesia sp.]|uniref:hypothetical protein n=1 Tax=uncultured Gimesia sp. TaxID=1678688 RepID=UPI0026262B5A|nr:hypothetical protein [uncultured Gimesia sp.]
MKKTITQFAILCLIFGSVFFTLPLFAEESYERFAVRNWTYRDGTQATGKMITVSGPTATLKLEGKGNVRVPLEKLSVKDLNWIYEYHKRKNKLSFLPPKYRKPQKDFSEPEPAKPTKTEPENNQPEKKMTVAEPKMKESYQPFTVREWNLKDGTKYDAKFLSINNILKKVILKREPGQIQQVPLDQFSEKDLNWLAEYHRRNKMLALLPAEYRDRVSKDQPAVETPGKPSPVMKTPNLPGGIAERQAELKAKSKAMLADGKAKAAAEDDPNVIKANTEIDPVLVAALRGYRVWSDKQGQKSEAIFTGIQGREVMFATRIAGFVRVPIGTLVEEDLQLLRDALKMHGRFAEIPLVYREPLDPNLPPRKLKLLIKVNNHRKWTDLSGNSVGASYVKMEDGKVTLLITKTGATQEFPYLNFIVEDQEYVQERLKKEIPGSFFPAGAEVTLTPEEREKEFRVWTDRSQRHIKGKFVKLAYGNSVAVINTGTKEELFITEFFSDQDQSLIKPRKQKQTDQLALNNNNSNPGGMNRGMAGREPISNNRGPGMNPNTNMQAFPGMQEPRWEMTCPICKKSHTSDSPFFKHCPHCGLDANDKVYSCIRCNRKFKAEGQGITAPCPHCNKNRPNNQVASGNTSPYASGSSGNNTNGSGSSVRSGTSAYRSGRAIGKICAWILMFVGFIFGVNKIRG